MTWCHPTKWGDSWTRAAAVLRTGSLQVSAALAFNIQQRTELGVTPHLLRVCQGEFVACSPMPRIRAASPGKWAYCVILSHGHG